MFFSVGFEPTAGVWPRCFGKRARCFSRSIRPAGLKGRGGERAEMIDQICRRTSAEPHAATESGGQEYHSADGGTELPLESIRLDGDIQPRATETEDATVTEYADAIRTGASFPPVCVFFDGQSKWLA